MSFIINQTNTMKKQILFAVLMLMGMAVQAQNVQLHYDFGRNIYSNEEAGRQKVTMTLEQFKADKWGSWFYFVDVDFSRKFTESAYTEISREINLSKKVPIAAHVEYNGGLNRFSTGGCCVEWPFCRLLQDLLCATHVQALLQEL